jgi:hypothetical protein
VGDFEHKMYFGSFYSFCLKHFSLQEEFKKVLSSYLGIYVK